MVIFVFYGVELLVLCTVCEHILHLACKAVQSTLWGTGRREQNALNSKRTLSIIYPFFFQLFIFFEENDGKCANPC